MRKFVFGGSYSDAAPLLLDLYPADAAYSLRKLRTAYSGSAIRVRRSSDNTEQDIGFLGNDLDTASLLSFVGANDGRVVRWYDQQGSNTAFQVTASSQPYIVVSGVIQQQDSKPCLVSNATNMGLALSPTVNTTNVFTVSRIFKQQIVNYIIANSTGGFGYNGSFAGVDGLFGFNGSALRSITGEDLNRHLGYFNLKSSRIFIAKDGAAEIDSGAFSTSMSFSYLTNRLAQRSDSNTQEIIIYNSDQTANKAAIESNINTYYGIY